MFFYQPYVSVAEQTKKAQKEIAKLRKKGLNIAPMDPFKGAIAKSFWGKGWIDNLERYADIYNRLDRGKRYLRAGCVCHLDIREGVIQALISGSNLYGVEIEIDPLPKEKWQALAEKCAGNLGSLVELLSGKLDKSVMAAVCDPETGLFPEPEEIEFECDCPDSADLCKHVAAVLYGVGRKLDEQPELLFKLRGVNPADLFQMQNLELETEGIEAENISDIFGIDLEGNFAAEAPVETPTEAEAQEKEESPIERLGALKKLEALQERVDIISKFDPFNPLGINTYALRKAGDISQEDMAQRLGIGLASVRNWERLGSRKPRYESRVKIQKLQKDLLKKVKKELAAAKKALKQA